MLLLSWDETFSVGVAQIDDQHRQLIDLINKIHTARADGNESAVIRRVIFQLFKYATHHFSEEESLMRDNNYPDFQTHYKEHEFFISRLDAIATHFGQGEIQVAGETFRFLVDWLLDHILTVDKKLGRFLIEGDRAK